MHNERVNWYLVDPVVIKNVYQRLKKYGLDWDRAGRDGRFLDKLSGLGDPGNEEIRKPHDTGAVPNASNNSEVRYESMHKPGVCPSCGSTRIADVMYGMPNFDDQDLRKEIESGKTVLGGCIVLEDNPAWQCADCKVNIHEYTRV